jgi:hypothetical protein
MADSVFVWSKKLWEKYHRWEYVKKDGGFLLTWGGGILKKIEGFLLTWDGGMHKKDFNYR